MFLFISSTMSDNVNESDTECSETEDSSDYYNLICDDTDIESINQEIQMIQNILNLNV